MNLKEQVNGKINRMFDYLQTMLKDPKERQCNQIEFSNKIAIVLDFINDFDILTYEEITSYDNKLERLERKIYQ